MFVGHGRLWRPVAELLATSDAARVGQLARGSTPLRPVSIRSPTVDYDAGSVGYVVPLRAMSARAAPGDHEQPR